MEFSTTIFLVVLGLGVLQLAVGVVFGRCLPQATRKRDDDARARGRFEAFRSVAQGVHQLVSGVTAELGRHREGLEQVHRQLSLPPSDDPAELSRFVLDRLDQLMAINGQLQTRLTAAEDQLRRQTEQIESHIVEARTDPLTRLPNRRAFDDALVRRVAEFQRRRAGFAVMILDVDHFKRLNDRHGHLAGDHVLRRLAELLQASIDPKALAARIGGEEFAVVLPDCTAAEASRAAERIREAVAAEPLRFDDETLRTTISIGIATVRTGDDPVSLVRRADEALYAAKRSGRNCAFLNDEGRHLRVQPNNPSELELNAICDDLRRRVAQLAGQARTGTDPTTAATAGLPAGDPSCPTTRPTQRSEATN